MGKVFNNSFVELEQDEMMEIEGGSAGQAVAVFFSTLAIAASPIALACGAVPLAGGLFLLGVGGVSKAVGN